MGLNFSGKPGLPPILVFNGVSQGSVLSPLFILIWINDLSVSISLWCISIADGLKLVCYKEKVNSLIKDLRQTFQYTYVCDVLPKFAAPLLVLPEYTNNISLVKLVLQSTNLRIVVNSQVNFSAQVTSAASKARTEPSQNAPKCVSHGPLCPC